MLDVALEAASSASDPAAAAIQIFQKLQPELEAKPLYAQLAMSQVAHAFAGLTHKAVYDGVSLRAMVAMLQGHCQHAVGG